MYCQNCGKEVTGNFCSNCGSKVIKDEPKPAEQESPQAETQETVSQPEIPSPSIPEDKPQTTEPQETKLEPPMPVSHTETASDSSKPYMPSSTAAEILKNAGNKKPFYKKWWFWCVIIVVLLFIIGVATSGDDSDNNSASPASKTTTAQSSDKTTTTEKQPNITVADFSAMSKEDIELWSAANKVECVFLEDYSDTVAAGAFISQSVAANEAVYEGSIIRITYSKGKEPPIEYRNALKKAEAYSERMYMSKKGIYDQLVSEYGEQFSAEAAQYAVDNLQADYKSNALHKAKSYQESMNMSKKAIYDQLISEYGEQFTKEEAQYAIDHLED